MENKKILWVLGLLFLVYLSSAGNYINSGDEYLADYRFVFAMIDLFIWSCLLMVYPFFCRLEKGRKLDAVRGKKICRWNSGAVLFFGFIIDVINFGGIYDEVFENMGANTVYVVIYYFINKWLFVDENLETKNTTCSNEIIIPFKCNNCDYEITEECECCPNCLLPFEEDEVTIDENISLGVIYNNGVSNIKSGKTEEGIKCLNQYIEEVEQLNKLSDDEWYTFNNCVEFALFTKENDLGDNKIVDVNYQTSNAYLYLAIVEFENKQYDESLKKLKKALDWNPNNIKALFEMAEIYKSQGDLKEYYNLTLELYNKIYLVEDLAHYYRNLGYYFVEKENWDISKALYLYSVRFENSDIALEELKYIINKSKDNTLPAKEDLEEILKEERIPIFITKEIINIVNELYNEVVETDEENTDVGEFVKKLLNTYNKY